MAFASSFFLLNQTGEYEKAKTVLDAHNFHPWEGGEGKVPAQYQLARVELAKKALTSGENKNHSPVHHTICLHKDDADIPDILPIMILLLMEKNICLTRLKWIILQCRYPTC